MQTRVTLRLIQMVLLAVAVLLVVGCGKGGEDKGQGQKQPIPMSAIDLPARAVPGDLLKDSWSTEGPASNLDESARLKLQTDRVVVFKDGHALVVKSATGRVDARGLLFTDEVPDDAIMGSFWATAADKILGMRAEWVNSQRQRSKEIVATNIEDLLRANEGEQVSLRMREGTAEVERACRILRMLDNPQIIDGPSPTLGYNIHEDLDAPEDSGTQTARRLSMSNAGGQFVLVGLADGTQQVLHTSQVIGLSGPKLRTTSAHHEILRQRTKRLVFDVGMDKAGQEVTLSIMYFRSGFRWVPTYRIEERGVDKVSLSLQAEIINDAESLDNAQIDLVVGVPNIKFSDMRSPLALESAMRSAYSGGYGNSARRRYDNDLGNLSNANFSNSIQAQAVMEPADFGDTGGSVDSQQWTARFDAGSQQMDLFVYKAGRLSVGKGGRATLPLWTSDAAKKDIFGVDFNVQRHSYADNSVDARTVHNKVWRYMTLQNASPVPWTTGPALMMREGFPVAQDLMTYTAPGRAVRLPVTVATNVTATHSEKELGRTPGAKFFNLHSYTSVRKHSTVKVVNSSTEAATVEVSFGSGGKADQVSDGGTAVVSDFNGSDWDYAHGDLNALNNHSNVTWTLTLKPGETKEVTAQFTYFVY